MMFENLIGAARKYLCVPATSSPVERLFSYGGYIFRPHRQRLTTKKLEKLTMLINNQKRKYELFQINFLKTFI